MEINLGPLLIKQAELDGRINSEHNVTHQSTKKERILALYVEIAELANATRVFKYWSLKASEERSVLLDEYADGLHFFLSLALVYNFRLGLLEVNGTDDKTKSFAVTMFNEVFTNIAAFTISEKSEDYYKALGSFLILGSALGYTSDDITEAYNAKMVVNYERQNTKY